MHSVIPQILPVADQLCALSEVNELLTVIRREINVLGANNIEVGMAGIDVLGITEDFHPYACVSL